MNARDCHRSSRRHFLSTQAYAAFRGSKLRLDDLGALLQPADLTFFLHADLEVRRMRLTTRGPSAADRETLAIDADRRLRAERAGGGERKPQTRGPCRG